MAFAPFVQPEDLEAWNAYSEANQGWIAEANDAPSFTAPILPHIWELPHSDHNRQLSTCQDDRLRKLSHCECPDHHTSCPQECGGGDDPLTVTKGAIRCKGIPAAQPNYIIKTEKK